VRACVCARCQRKYMYSNGPCPLQVGPHSSELYGTRKSYTSLYTSYLCAPTTRTLWYRYCIFSCTGCTLLSGNRTESIAVGGTGGEGEMRITRDFRFYVFLRSPSCGTTSVQNTKIFAFSETLHRRQIDRTYILSWWYRVHTIYIYIYIYYIMRVSYIYDMCTILLYLYARNSRSCVWTEGGEDSRDDRRFVCRGPIVRREIYTRPKTFSRWITFRFIKYIFFSLKYFIILYIYILHARTIYNDDDNNSCVLRSFWKSARGSHTSGGGHPTRSLIISRSPPRASVPRTHTQCIIYNNIIIV